MMRLSVLGSTGSVGAATLDLAGRHADVSVHALCARQSDAAMLAQCRRHRPRHAVLVEAEPAERLRRAVRAEGLEVEVHAGMDAVCAQAASPQADCVMAGMVGIAGLAPALAAVRAGKRVLLANKEALVAAGRLFMAEARAHSCTLVPVDSEHNALFQCLRGSRPGTIESVLLTASGGPFRGLAQERLTDVSPDEACAHPTWSMGRKISVDSATMMNKGLEVIEARWLFDLEPAQIDIVMHPQSILHALVTLQDGATLAHLGPADMRAPIAYALFGEERRASGAEPLDVRALGGVEWAPVAPGAYPCLDLARGALEAGGAAPVALNAANEAAVAAFLARRIRYTDIPAVVERALEGVRADAPADLDAVRALDAQARALAATAIAKAA